MLVDLVRCVPSCAGVDALKAAGFDDVDEDACNRLFSGFAVAQRREFRKGIW